MGKETRTTPSSLIVDVEHCPSSGDECRERPEFGKLLAGQPVRLAGEDGEWRGLEEDENEELAGEEEPSEMVKD